MAIALSYTLTVKYNANGGSGAPSTQAFSEQSTDSTVTVSGTLSSTKPIKSGYTFSYWSSSMGAYWSGSTISKTFTRNGSAQFASVTLYAQYTKNVTESGWGTTPSSVSLNGSTSYTFNIDKSSTVDHHTVKLTLGNEYLRWTNVNTSVTATFPTSWQEQLPSSTSGSLTCDLTSYDADGNKVGSKVTKTITAKVPSSVVPTVSVTAERVNDNSAVAGWGILLQGYSKIKLYATASGTNGSTVSSIKYYGAGINKTTTATNAISSVINANGYNAWTVTVTDSRGRTAEAAYSEQVYPYSPPSISRITAHRCTSAGAINEATGTYALFNAVFAFSDANNNNTISLVIDYKLHTGSTWTTLVTSYTSGTDAVIGGGVFDVDKTYDIRLTITDALNNTATFSVFLASVQGFAIGLKNDRARFGGVPVRAGLQIDWDIFLGNKQLMKSLWTGTWDTGDITVDGISQYRMCIVRMSGQGTLMLAFIYDNGSTVFFRGEGGYAVSASAETRYYISATLSGDTLIMDDCHSINASGTRTARTVVEIIGVI